MKQICVVVVAICLSIGMAQSQSWSTLNGPQVASNVRDISVTTNGGNLFIADNGHVLRSTNGGEGWAVTSYPKENPLFVLVKPNNENIVLAAKNTELAYSSNGGGSWSTISGLTDLTPLRLVAGAINNNIMYMGRTFITGNNAIWWSTNGGEDWSKVTTFGAETNIHDFASYPTSGQGRNGVLLAGGIKPGGGAPDGANHSSAAVTSGLWKSVDDGANWDENGLGDCNVRSVAIVPKASGTDYIRLAVNAKSGNDELLRNTSLTNNNNWNAVTLDPAPADIYLVRRMGNGHIFLATSNGVWRTPNTTDDGATWSRVGFSGTSVISIAVSSSGDNVFAGTATTLYKSTDNGDTWKNVGDMDVSSVEAAQITVGETSTQYSWAVTKDNNIAARYTGSSWERKTIGNEGVQFSVESIYRNSTTGTRFAAGALGTSGALFSSTDDGANYTQVSITNYTLQAGSRYHGIVRAACGVMYLFGGGTLATGGSGWRNVFNSTNEGVTWNAIADVGGNNLLIYDLVGPTGSILYAAASNGIIYASTNGGTNWAVSRDNVGSVARSIAVNPAFPAIVYAGGSNGLWKTTNSGSSWSQVGSGTISNVLRVMMHPSYQGSSDYVWVVSVTSGVTKIYKTTNGGANWTDFSTGVATPITTLGDDGVNKGYSYLGTADGAYWINEPPAAPPSFAGTIQGGNPGYPHLTWSSIESDLAAQPFYVYRSPLACIGYCPNKSCMTIDDPVELGPTSNSYYNDTETSVASCGTAGVVPGMVGYYATAKDNIGQVSSNTANILFNKGESNEERTWTPPVEPEALPTEFSLFDNFPNPFNPVTMIRYVLPADVYVNLTIVDVLGREVSVLVNERQTAGYKSVEFDAVNLASGVYLYKLTAGTFTDIKKMVVAK